MKLTPDFKRQLMTMLIEEQGGKCNRCHCVLDGPDDDLNFPTLDHVHPRRVATPRDVFENYQALCVVCNHTKGQDEPTRREVRTARMRAKRIRSRLNLQRHLERQWWWRADNAGAGGAKP